MDITVGKVSQFFLELSGPLQRINGGLLSKLLIFILLFFSKNNFPKNIKRQYLDD